MSVVVSGSYGRRQVRTSEFLPMPKGLDNLNAVLKKCAGAMPHSEGTKGCYNENFNGFSLTKFDGTTITV